MRPVGGKAMAIGPIYAVRPVSMIKPSPEDPELSRAVEVEHLGRSEDDEYTPANRKASRGLEDEAEDEDHGAPSADLENRKDTGALTSNVSVFA
jgi:hypothetical protein